MGKKKSFVNKKNSATFRLVYRDSPSTFSDPFGFLNDGERVFTRVDEGTSYVPGFTDDDPRANLEEGETDSVFADADEDSGEEANIRPKKDKYKSTHPIPHGSNNGQGQGPLPDHIRKEIIELGFPDDGYNYLMHMREIRASGGGSAFVPCRKPRLESIRPDVKLERMLVHYSIKWPLPLRNKDIHKFQKIEVVEHPIKTDMKQV